MLHIAPPLDSLLTRLDVDYSNSVLHERKNVIDKDLNFRVTDLSAVPALFGDQQLLRLWRLGAQARRVIKRHRPNLARGLG